MRVCVLTADGQWWTIAPDLTKDEKAFEQLWCKTGAGDLIETIDDGIYVQKCCITAVDVRKDG